MGGPRLGGLEAVGKTPNVRDRIDLTSYLEGLLVYLDTIDRHRQVNRDGCLKWVVGITRAKWRRPTTSTSALVISEVFYASMLRVTPNLVR